jgi:hypothetical protein
MSRTILQPVKIANGQTTSAEVDIPDGYEVVGLFAPVCTGTALTFTAAAASGGTFVQVTDKTQTAISLTLSGTAFYMGLDSTLLKGLQQIKFVSNQSEGADRSFNLALKKSAT